MNRTLQIFGKTLFPVLELYFGEQALSAFRKRQSDLVLYHFTLRAWLRNAFLHPEMPFSESFVRRESGTQTKCPLRSFWNFTALSSLDPIWINHNYRAWEVIHFHRAGAVLFCSARSFSARWRIPVPPLHRGVSFLRKSHNF